MRSDEEPEQLGAQRAVRKDPRGLRAAKASMARTTNVAVVASGPGSGTKATSSMVKASLLSMVPRAIKVIDVKGAVEVRPKSPDRDRRRR